MISDRSCDSCCAASKRKLFICTGTLPMLNVTRVLIRRYLCVDVRDAESTGLTESAVAIKRKHGAAGFR